MKGIGSVVGLRYPVEMAGGDTVIDARGLFIMRRAQRHDYAEDTAFNRENARRATRRHPGENIEHYRARMLNEATHWLEIMNGWDVRLEMRAALAASETDQERRERIEREAAVWVEILNDC